MHEPLHTSYGAARRSLPIDAAVDIVELGSMSAEEFDRFANDQRRLPFDLDNGPLVRVHIAHAGPSDVSILIGLHHISIDAGTFDLLWDQIAAWYATGRLPEVAATYAAHGAWQRTKQDRARAFWLERAGDRPPAARLALTPPMPPEPDGYLSRQLDVSPSELSARGHTPFAVAMAATTVVLSQAASSPRVEFGITASTKDRPDLHDVVGYYLNTLPMAFDAHPNDSFTTLMRGASSQIAATIEHRSYPFADIVRDARAAGLVAPDVSCMLAYEQLAPGAFPGAAAEHRILASGTAVADLTLFVQERPDRVQLGLEYRGSVLGRDDARRLLDMFASVLIDGASAADRSVAELTAGFRGGDVVGDELGPVDSTILQQIVRRADASPHSPAAVDSSGRSLDYDQLLVSAAAGCRPDRGGIRRCATSSRCRRAALDRCRGGHAGRAARRRRLRAARPCRSLRPAPACGSGCRDRRARGRRSVIIDRGSHRRADRRRCGAALERGADGQCCAAGDDGRPRRRGLRDLHLRLDR